MIFLFLGILLLIAGYFYFGYNKTEGFQSSGVSLCTGGTNDQKCDMSCMPPDPLITETSEELTAYGIYESYNLLDTNLIFPPVVAPTFLEKYNTAGSLSLNNIDMSKPIPWDFDNLSLDPAISFFGNISAEASQLIFAKCQAQALHGDINNFDYDPNSGIFSYKSPMFTTTVYDRNVATSMQFSEMMINTALGELMGMLFDKIGAMPNELNKDMNFIKEANFKTAAQIRDYKAELEKTGSKTAAARAVRYNTQIGVYDKEFSDAGNRRSQITTSNIDAVPGMSRINRGPFKFGRESIIKIPYLIDFRDPNRAAAQLDAYEKSNIDSYLKDEAKAIQGGGVRPYLAYRKYRQMYSDIYNNNKEVINTPKGFRVVNKRVSDFTSAGQGVVNNAATKHNAVTYTKMLQAQLQGLITEVSFRFVEASVYAQAYLTRDPVLLGSTAILFRILDAVSQAVELAAMTFIPALLSSFIEYDAVCPYNSDGTQMSSIEDYFLGNPSSGQQPFFGTWGPAGGVAGALFYTIIQALPRVGALISAFGKDICFAKDATKEGLFGGIKFKNNLRLPPYYYDPTLSIYNIGARPKFQAGNSNLDERLFNPLLFHFGPLASEPKDENQRPGYPVWVDFANPIMLNKMAQFYYDASRKCPSTTDDGMLAFQYITKFYGLISTTPVTCDVQCEITEIKFDPKTGNKICQVIIPTTPGNLTTLHHDRRFYFYRDMGKSVINRNVRIDRNDLPALQALMEDNLNIYTVTGCTNVDGTAPDCLTYNSEGDSTLNPVISLGEPSTPTRPSSKYYPGIVDPRNVLVNNELPMTQGCSNSQSPFARFGGVNNPNASNQQVARNNQNAPLIKSEVAHDWIYAYKDEKQRYFFPSENVDGQAGVTPDSLRTAKYWSVVWNNICGYEDINCQINSRQGALSIVQGTMEGLVGCGFAIAQIAAARRGIQGRTMSDPSLTLRDRQWDAAAAIGPLAGGMLQVGLNAVPEGQQMSISQQIRCTYEQLTRTPGSYIMNGRVMTSQLGFVIDQGPFINWAPGYTPSIQFCNKQTIELYDCVNSYAVRRFVNIYNTQYPNRQIKRINNITPTLNTKSKWDVKNSIAMCMYNIDVAQFDPVLFKEIVDTTSTINVGLYLQQNVSNGTCTFVPRCMPDMSVNPPVNRAKLPYNGSEFIVTPVPAPYEPQVFSVNTDEPIWPPTGVTTTTPLLLPNSPVALTATSRVRNEISSSGLEAIGHLSGVVSTANLPPTFAPVFDTIVANPVAKFNCGNVDKQTELISTFNSAHDGVPKLLSITKSLSMSTIGGEKYCLFRAKFGSVPDPNNLKNTINVSNSETDAPERNITIRLSAQGTFFSDDYPIHFSYTPIPKRAQWFDVPPRTQLQLSSTSFARPNCANDAIYNDCSNTALIDILVTEYNKQAVDSKILKVLRSFTPVNGARPNYPVCDYDVERLKKLTGTPPAGTAVANPHILNRETIRFFLKPTTQVPCAYELDFSQTITNAENVNGGVSLNSSDELGTLKVPYNTALSYTKAVQSQFFTSIRNYLGYDMNTVITNATSNLLSKVQDVRETLFTNTTLQGCPSKTCMDDTIIKAMINRYNYDNYPAYPPTQNTVTSKNTIIRVVKVGTATSKKCQVELYLRNDFFVDFLYNPLPQDTRFYLRIFSFDLTTTLTPCKFNVKPFTPDDILYSRMDISGDAFTLKCPPTGRCPSLITASSAASQVWATTEYTESMILCNIIDTSDPIVRLVTNIYNSTVVFTKSGTPYYNTLKKITKVFNAMPNILEFKITTKRVYWDSAYNIAYYTGVEDNDDAFLVVTWPVGTDYEVETGYYWKNNLGSFIPTPSSGIGVASGMARKGTDRMCTPVIQEFFFPDLTFASGKIFKTISGSQTEVQLPYLANDTLTPVDERQTKKYRCNPTTCINTDGTAV